MKPPSERKTRLTEATLEWLKERASATEWKQIELLKPAGAEAILNYVYTVAPAAYEELHRLCLVPPDLRIDKDGVPPPTTAEIVSGGPVWKTLAQAAEDERQARIQKLREDSGLVECPPVELPSLEELREAGECV